MDALVTFDDGDKVKMNIWVNGGGQRRLPGTNGRKIH